MNPSHCSMMWPWCDRLRNGFGMLVVVVVGGELKVLVVCVGVGCNVGREGMNTWGVLSCW